MRTNTARHLVYNTDDNYINNNNILRDGECFSLPRERLCICVCVCVAREVRLANTVLVLNTAWCSGSATIELPRFAARTRNFRFRALFLRVLFSRFLLRKRNSHPP